MTAAPEPSDTIMDEKLFPDKECQYPDTGASHPKVERLN